MNGFSSFIISFCVGCIMLGFLDMLCPSGSMSKSVKYIFCLCFVCCIICTVAAIPEPNFSYFKSNNTTEIITEQNVASTAQSIFAEALHQTGLNFRKIMVDTNKLSDGSIVISKVTVYTSESAQNINAAIGSDSYEVDVINE